MKIQISEIRIDGGTQPRARTNLEIISEYSDDMERGDKFPPVVVFHDGEAYWLADGFHRRDAAIRAGLCEIEADVRKGSLRDAVLFSVGVNSAHGQRRTNDDKRRAVIKLLEDTEWSKWSNREIASRCAVSPGLVDSLRKELSANGRQMDPERTVERNGTTYTVNTENIGKHPEPEPVVEDEPEEEDPADDWTASEQFIGNAIEIVFTRFCDVIEGHDYGDVQPVAYGVISAMLKAIQRCEHLKTEEVAAVRGRAATFSGVEIDINELLEHLASALPAGTQHEFYNLVAATAKKKSIALHAAAGGAHGA